MYEIIQVENQMVKVEPNPTLAEKMAFVLATIKRALSGSINNDSHGAIYLTMLEACFDTMFLCLFTDFDFPDEVKNDDFFVDVFKVHDYIRRTDIREKFRSNPKVGKLITLLEDDVRQRVEFESRRNFSGIEVIDDSNKSIDDMPKHREALNEI